MTDFQQSMKKQIQRELNRVNAQIAELKSEPRSEELESGGDNTPLSEEIDASMVTEEKEIRSDLLGRLLDRAAALDQALRRLDLETYGVCVSCNQRISRKRLELVPEAALCTRCQTQREESTPSDEPGAVHWMAVEDFYDSKKDYEG